MPLSAYRPEALRGRYFRGSIAVRQGLLTRDQLYGPAWRKVFQDVYVDAQVPDSHLLRCQAAVLVLPVEVALTGRSAARFDGLPLGDANDPVHVVQSPGGSFRAQGFRARRAFLPSTHVLQGEPSLTIPARTAWEIAREPDLVEAVMGLDVLLSHRYVWAETLSGWAASQPHSRAARAIRLADGRAESPQESRARVRIILAGFPPPVPQYEVWMRSLLVARLDLAWPKVKVGCEYDGAWHGDRRQLPRDRARLNRLVEAGWVILHLTAQDLEDPVLFARFTEQLRSVLASR
jgi:very-short-patch-repair endonuclease